MATLPGGGAGGGGSGDPWWIILTASATGGSGFMVVQGSQAEIDRKYGGPPVVRGPFSTQADAEKSAKGAVGSGSNSISEQGPVAGGNPLDALGEIAHWAGVIITNLTDVHMWISLGWMALGLILITMGILLWLKVPQRAAGIGTTVAAGLV